MEAFSACFCGRKTVYKDCLWYTLDTDYCWYFRIWNHLDVNTRKLSSTRFSASYFPRCTQYHLLKAAVRDGNANMSVRNEIKAGKKANKFYRPKRPKRYCFTVLCLSFINLNEFLARRREDCLSFPLWWRVSQGKFLFSTKVGLRYPMSQLSLKQGPRTIASKFAVLSLSWPQGDSLQANYVALTGYISSRVCLLIFAQRD